MKTTLYCYADRIIAHLCSLAAARVEMALCGPKMVVSGLWSVKSMNL